MPSLLLVALALGVTLLSFWKRFIVFTMGAALAWLALGIILVTNPGLIGIPSLGEPWGQVLAFIFFAICAGCLLYYLAGIGRTKITMTDMKGRSWQIWSKPPSQSVISRSQIVKQAHRARIGRASGRIRR